MTPRPLASLLLVACGTSVTPPLDEAAGGDDTEEVIEVSTGARIRLADENGAPVQGAAVVIDQGYELVRGSAGAPLRAGTDGVVALDEALPSRSIVLAWAPGRSATRLELPEEDVPQEARVTLGAPTALHGRLLGRGRVEHVWLQSGDSEAPWPYFVRADVDAEGRFHVAGVAGGTYRVSAVPIGSAPVLAASTDGAVRFLAAEPGSIEPAGHHFLDREITADGRARSLRVAFGVAPVAGTVVDEDGGPVEGATVRLRSEAGAATTAVTDARGAWSAGVRPTPHLWLEALHPDFGEQWTDMEWDGWRHGGPIPEAPVRLTLRRGVELSGRLVDERGAPRANERILLVPAYVGSGPATREARTDAQGRFRFERMVLRHFELVPHGLAHWHPREPGAYLRIAGDAAAWVEAAAAGRAIELRAESYELLPLVLRVGARRQVEVWMRWGQDASTGSAPDVVNGRVRIAVERGVAHEVWVRAFDRDRPLTAPWTRGEPPDWSGTPEAPLELTIEPR